MFKKLIYRILLQKIILILFFGILCSISKLYSQSKENQLEWFPLSNENYWVYEGIVKWQSMDSLDNIVVMEDTITFNMEVIEKVNAGEVKVYALKGFPFLLYWYEPDQEKDTFYVAQKGFNKYYQTDIETFNLAEKIMVENQKNSSEKSGAEKMAHILVKAHLKKRLEDDYLFLDFPLTLGKKFGPQSNVERGDNMYCWFVEDSVNTDIENIKGLPVRKGMDKYILSYKTLPEGIEFDFVPGIGITRFRFKHMGTVSESDVRLIEYSSNANKNR